jgi:hypothetical protein
VCIHQKYNWKHMHISKYENSEEIKLYWGSKIANKIRSHGEETSNKLRKQSNDPKNKLNKDIMIRPK